jgi:glycosyltransferase involved in cell wall biosynthesis
VKEPTANASSSAGAAAGPRAGSTADAPPAVSVVIPCFNAAATLPALLESLAAQTLPRDQFEIIVVDDGSTDSSRELAANVAGVTVLTQSHEGPGAARNLGARRARGELVLYLDSDLRAAPDLLAGHLEYHRAHADVAATGGSVKPADLYPPLSWIMVDHLCSWFNAHPSVRYSSPPEYLPSLNFCIKKELIARCALTWNAGLEHTGEDVLFCRDLRQAGLALAFLPRATVYHRDRDSMRGYLIHMYRWGFHAPYVRGACRTLRYGFLFRKTPLQLAAMLPAIVLGYTALVWASWLRRRPAVATLALPAILLGRIAFAAGVWAGTRKKYWSEADK